MRPYASCHWFYETSEDLADSTCLDYVSRLATLLLLPTRQIALDQHVMVRDVRLVQSLRRAHASLNCQATHVLPGLLQQAHQVVDSQHDVADQLILSHPHIPHRNTKTQDLLQLELDRALDFRDLSIEVFAVGDGSRELAGLRETGAEETRNLLDQRLRRNEGVVFAGEFLDELLVLVEFLEVVGGHGVDAVVFRAVDVVLVTENAIIHYQYVLLAIQVKGRCGAKCIPDTHARTRDSGELDGAGETLVTLRVIVLQADLEFDGLEEVSLLLVERVVEKLLHILAHSGWKDVSVCSMEM